MSVGPVLVLADTPLPVGVNLPRCDPFAGTIHHLSLTPVRKFQALLHANNGIVLDQHISLECMRVGVTILEGKDETVLEKDVCHGK